jgi:hypothetical protein
MGYLDRLMETSGLSFGASARQSETANAIAAEGERAPVEIHDTVTERRVFSNEMSVPKVTRPPSRELSAKEVTSSRPNAPRPALPMSEPVDGDDTSMDVRRPNSVESESSGEPPVVVISAEREQRVAPGVENEQHQVRQVDREMTGAWTLAAVNEWVSAPVRDVVDMPQVAEQAEVVVTPAREAVRRAEEPFAEATPGDIEEFSSVHERTVTAEPETNVTVSIGAIEVIVDAPMPPLKREPSQPARQPNGTTGADLSRYYIRPSTGL